MKILTFLLLPLVCFGLWNIARARVSSAQAEQYGGLTINTGVPEGDPIFVVANFLPGDCEEREIIVTNTSNIPEDLTVRSSNVQDNDLLSEVLNIEISESSNVLYDKSVKEFFTDSGTLDGILLNSISPNQTKTYKFLVCFNVNADNRYQNTRVVFDLIFGNVISPIELPEECSHLRGIVTSVINGTNKNDRIDGTSASELILGNGGNDRIDGGSGNDCIVTLGGDDRVDGGSGNDVIVGGDGNNRLEGGAGDDFIYSGSSMDRINGGSGNDTIYGGAGNDRIYGDSGNDYLYGEDGDDRIDGDAGNDHLYGGNGKDKLDGGTGTDSCMLGEQLTRCETQ